MTYDPASPYQHSTPEPAAGPTGEPYTQPLPRPEAPAPAAAAPTAPPTYQPGLYTPPTPYVRPATTAGTHQLNQPSRPSATSATAMAGGGAAGTAFQAAPPARAPKTPWVRMTAVAAVVAVAASLGTAAATGAFDKDNSASASHSSGSQGVDTATGGQTVQPVQDSTSDNPNWEKVASAVRNSVVAIQVSGTSGEAEGSGVIVDSEKGYVVTNNHVISAGSTIQIALTDGTVHEASVVGSDPTTDLAVLKFTDVPSGLVAATLGDSSAVAIGQQVMAVGNPLGLDNTVTTGIVSALNRPVTTSQAEASATDAVVTNAIQTDAPINPGNSGGPLFNAKGEVIGINSSIASMSSGSSSAGSIGLGFAIPSNTVKMITDQLIASGKADHAYLGVSLADGTATVEGQTRAGAQVKAVTDSTPAAQAGLQVGDVIVAVNGEVVTSSTSLVAFVRSFAVGDKVTVSVVRDGAIQDIEVTLATAPAASAQQPQSQPQQQQGPGQLGQDGTGQLPQELQDLLEQYLGQQQGGAN